MSVIILLSDVFQVKGEHLLYSIPTGYRCIVTKTRARVIRIKSYTNMCPGKSGLKYKVFFYRLDHFTAQ